MKIRERFTLYPLQRYHVSTFDRYKMLVVGVFKYFLISLTLLSALFGAIIVLFHESHNPTPIELYFFDQVIHQLLFISNVIIPLGITSLVIAVYLCWRIAFEKYNVLQRRFVYFLISLITTLTLFAFCLYSQQDASQKKVRENVQHWVQEYHDRPKTRSIVDYIQTELECCGSTSVDDWYYHANGIPPSCCIINFTSKDVCLEENVFSVGCSDVIENLVGQTHMKFLWIIIRLILIMAIMLSSSIAIRYIQIKENKHLK